MGQDRCIRPVYTDVMNKAVLESAEAKKDNDFIYHERIPDGKNLEPISKAIVAKSMSMPTKFSSKFKGIYFYLNSLFYVINIIFS